MVTLQDQLSRYGADANEHFRIPITLTQVKLVEKQVLPVSLFTPECPAGITYIPTELPLDATSSPFLVVDRDAASVKIGAVSENEKLTAPLACQKKPSFFGL